jgi:hypothetical protein
MVKTESDDNLSGVVCHVRGNWRSRYRLSTRCFPLVSVLGALIGLVGLPVDQALPVFPLGRHI